MKDSKYEFTYTIHKNKVFLNITCPQGIRKLGSWKIKYANFCTFPW